MPAPSPMVPEDSLAPDFSLNAIDGSWVSLEQYRGRKHVVLVFLRGFG